MALPALTLRRRAACLVLSPLLSEDALADALKLQYDTMRSDNVSDIVTYIDQVADRHAFDVATRKRLYQAYFQALRLPESELPLDPWPAMQAMAVVPPPSPAPVPAPLSAPTPPSPAASAAVPRPAPASAAAAAASSEPAPADSVVVFAAVYRAVLADMQQSHADQFEALRREAKALTEDMRLPAGPRSQLLVGWTAPQHHAWLVVGDEATLAQAVNVLYVALCETLGPVEADRLLARAVRSASQIPQARQFSPQRLI